jgi:hypothetical protein
VTTRIPQELEEKILDKGDEFFKSRRRNAVALKDVAPSGLLQELQPKMGRPSLRRFVQDELGVDSVKYPFWGENVVVLDPDNVRSRFAAFDPWRRNSAIAAAMGVAAPDLLAEELAHPDEPEPPLPIRDRIRKALEGCQ